MKKIMTYKNKLARWSMMALLPVLATGCLSEFPEETADGEVGVDPTSVTVEAEISLDLNLPDSEDASVNNLYVNAANYPDVLHRITIAAYEGTALAERVVVYEDLPLTNRFQTRVSVPLHARDYRLAVWVDYYGDFDTDEIAETDSCYNTFDFTTVMKPKSKSYVGNNRFEDAFYGCQDLDLTRYRDEWGAKVPVSMELARPAGRFELVATDVTDFLALENVASVTDPEGGSAFRVYLDYDGSMPVGYDVLSDVTRHAFDGMSFNASLRKTALENAGGEYSLLFDYILIDPDETFSVPVTLRVVNAEDTNVEYARYSFRLQCKRGVNTVIRAPFLTTDPNGGIGFDPDFDDEIDVDLDN